LELSPPPPALPSFFFSLFFAAAFSPRIRFACTGCQLWSALWSFWSAPSWLSGLTPDLLPDSLLFFPSPGPFSFNGTRLIGPSYSWPPSAGNVGFCSSPSQLVDRGLSLLFFRLPLDTFSQCGRLLRVVLMIHNHGYSSSPPPLFPSLLPSV